MSETTTPPGAPTATQRAIARENAEQLAMYLEAQQCGQQTKQARIIRELLAATMEPDR